MPKKRAKDARAIAVYASCGYCGEQLEDPDSGSFMLEPREEVLCSNCGTVNVLPKRVQFRWDN